LIGTSKPNPIATKLQHKNEDKVIKKLLTYTKLNQIKLTPSFGAFMPSGPRSGLPNKATL